MLSDIKSDKVKLRKSVLLELNKIVDKDSDDHNRLVKLMPEALRGKVDCALKWKPV